jgi:EpsI family protein
MIAALTYLACWADSGVNSVSKAGVVMNLPVFVGPYIGDPIEPSLSEKTILPPDTEFERRIYHGLAGEEINCGIVLAGGQKRSIHRPEVCLEGQGWTIPIGEKIAINLKSGRSLSVMKLTIRRPVELMTGEKKELRQLFLYWFVGEGRTTADHFERILLTSRDRVFRNINHRWAYVTVSSVVTCSVNPDGKDDAETLAMLKDFIREIVPTFQKSELPESAAARDTLSENHLPSPHVLLM